MGIYLRALEVGDYKKISQWRNDREVDEFLVGNFFYNSPDREKKWLEGVAAMDGSNVRLGAVLEENDKLIGMVNLVNIEWIHRKAEFSILLGDKEEWGKGYGKEATAKMLEIGFRRLNLEKIYLTVDAEHIKAISLYEKLRFRRDAVLRNHLFKDGGYRNVVVYSILKNEYV